MQMLVSSKSQREDLPIPSKKDNLKGIFHSEELKVEKQEKEVKQKEKIHVSMEDSDEDLPNLTSDEED